MIGSDAFLLGWASCMIAGMMIAMSKGRNPAAWLILTLATGPFGLALLLYLPHSGRDPSVGIERESMELCGRCFEPVRRDSPACRYCGVARTRQA